MQMNQVLAAVVIGAGIFGWTQYASGKHSESVAKEFELTEHQIKVMHSCEASLSRHSRKFKEDIDPLRGCGCIAKRMTKTIKTEQYDHANAVVDLLIERSKRSKPGKLTEDFKSKPKLAGLGLMEKFTLVMAANKSMGYCAKRANINSVAAENVKIPDLSSLKN